MRQRSEARQQLFIDHGTRDITLTDLGLTSRCIHALLTQPAFSATYLLVIAIDTSHALFLLEVLGLLAIPGPTNSLLFVSGVTGGLRANLKLILAELAGYLISISLLVCLLEPASRSHSTTSQLLRVLCSLYLAHMALWLWRSGARDVHDADLIGFRRVFLTTLLNPKTLIFAFAIFPAAYAQSHKIIPYFMGFSVICAAVACCWIAGGALLHSVGAHKSHLDYFYRGEAFLLAGFAIVILVSAYY
jgi:threonine/homoserine/homoserine lactone efflux protein